MKQKQRNESSSHNLDITSGENEERLFTVLPDAIHNEEENLCTKQESTIVIRMKLQEFQGKTDKPTNSRTFTHLFDSVIGQLEKVKWI